MIFVTVGTQLPYPRLIQAMDAICGDLGEEVVAQTGPEPGALSHLTAMTHLTPSQFAEKFTSSRVVVAHAGIGTILSAKRYGKPLVIVPRRADLGEHRNDHQMATAHQVEKLPGIHVAWDVGDLQPILSLGELEPANEDMSPTRRALVERLREFIAA